MFQRQESLENLPELNCLKRIAVQKKKGKFILMRLKSSMKHRIVFKACWSDHVVTERR